MIQAFVLLMAALVCIAAALFAFGSSVIDLVKYLASKARHHAALCIALMLGSAYAFAESSGSDGDAIALLVDLIAGMDGQMSWVDWSVIGVIAVHLLATVYVNVTDTPNDDTLYGRAYRYIIEPLAGLLVKTKAKQKRLSEIRFK